MRGNLPDPQPPSPRPSSGLAVLAALLPPAFTVMGLVALVAFSLLSDQPGSELFIEAGYFSYLSVGVSVSSHSSSATGPDRVPAIE